MKKVALRIFGGAGILLLVGLVGSGCRPHYVETAPTVTEYTPTFAYKFKDAGSAAKSDISITLIRPHWPAPAAQVPSAAAYAGLGYGQTPLGDVSGKYNETFARSIATDLEQLLTNRGFTFSGPFDSLDEMTFPQKKQADLVLVTEIAVHVNIPQINAAPRNNVSPMSVAFNGAAAGVSVYYSAIGNCTASGFIAFQVYEPLSAQKLWLKKVNVDGVAVPCSVSETDDAKLVQTTLSNGIAKVLEQIYPKIMDRAEIYFVSDEMALVKKQSAELREKKVY